MEKYSEALKEIRLEKNLSTLDVEKATGIKNANISRWENGKTIPGINFCIQLAQFYGCTLDELVGLSDTPMHNVSTNLPTAKQTAELSFAREYSDIISDNNFINVAKLYKAIAPELRALTLGYIVGLLQSNGVNTKNILGY